MFMPIIPKKIVGKVLKVKRNKANRSYLCGWDLAVGLGRGMARTSDEILCPLTRLEHSIAIVILQKNTNTVKPQVPGRLECYFPRYLPPKGTKPRP